MASTTKQPFLPVHWDPVAPASLLLPACTPAADANATPSDDSSHVVLSFESFLADDGVGCNDHEKTALMLLVEAHEAYFAGKQKGQWTALKSLSKSYRGALRDCLKGWDATMEGTPKDASTANDEVSLELLKVVYAVTHLSEIYLLIPPSGDFENTASMQGAITAETVRYLRLHHMEDAFSLVDGASTLEEILESPQPEQFNSYWKVVTALVLRGCLDEAWSLLSHHSICRKSLSYTQSEPLDEYHAASLAEDRENFLALQAVMLSAPLPGGRTDGDDAGLDDTPNEASPSSETHLDGVPRAAYKLWESGGPRADEDFPLSYNPHAAKDAHRAWGRYVQEWAPLHALTRRVPQLQTILSILRGQFDNIEFSSWGEALCAELLYVRPALRPDDTHVRTSRVMEKIGVSTMGKFDEVILSIMKGNVGRVIQVLHDFGGGSGAALPATMTALLGSLLTDAKVMPSVDDSSSSNIQTQLLLTASEAILSSLCASNADFGVLLSTRVLLPYATPSGDTRIIATLGETLERYAPQTDAETRTLLSLCHKLVERKCVRVLDGCVGLVLSRYRQYVKDRRPGGAVHWLLQGIELEKLVYANSDGDHLSTWQRVLSTGVCGRFLTTYCVTKAQALLKSLVNGESSESIGSDYAMAKEMVESIREDDNSATASRVPEVKLLYHVFDMARTVVEEEGDEKLARHIVACLEESVDEDNDGVVSALAHPCMYGDFISLATNILRRDEERDRESGERFGSSFDVNGTHVVMSRFTEREILAQKLFDEDGNVSAVAEEDPAREALCKGLARAFVKENAKLKTTEASTTSPVSVGAIRSTQLASYSRSDQERAVELMLGPSL